jgi:hypothetical protein
MVKWADICAPNDLEGICILASRCFNKAHMLKWTTPDHSRKFPYPLRLRSSFDSFYKIICHQESRWRSDIDWGRVVSIMWDPQVVNPHNGHMSRS